MTLEKKQIYCSLDIETSGFDPLTNEILEVGFAFFEVGGKGIIITEEWTQVFCPERLVPPQILGLTGISQNELDTAPKFSEFKELLQEKLGSAIIVGHNVGFDTKFLESSGLKFSGQIIDTLDLVQWLLPTHHSYNLENLMHTFSISHKEAHRALADSKATLLLLEKLLGVYNGFDAKLKSAIGKLIKGSNFTWVELLENSLPDISFAKAAKKTESKKFKSQTKKNNSLSANMIYDFGMDDNFVRETAMLAQKQGNALLVVPKARQVLELYKDGLVDAAVFSPEVSFDEKKFLVTLKKKVTTPEEVKFLLKILVWYHTNWQTETITDLNLSFFGGQFKSLITGGKIIEHKNSGVAVCDMEVFLFLAENGLYAKRLAVVCGLNEFENTIVSNVGTKTSWGYLNYLLKSYYNSETETGDLKYKSAVEAALVASDLFFGLTSALLQSDPPGFMYFKITPQTENDERYVKIKGAGVSFAEKIAEANKVLKSKDLIRFLENITSFFEEAENRVRWIELAENRCSFVNMPLSITGLVKSAVKKFAEVSFADELVFTELLEFFVKRLGLESFVINNHSSVTPNVKISPTTRQGDLFSSLKKVLGSKKSKVMFHIWPKAVNMEELRGLFGNTQSLPAAVLLPNQTQVREFYDANYQSIKKFASLLAQSNSGGSNKIFRNFSINPNSLLLATDKFILRAMSGNQAVDPVSKLAVKTLVLCRLPFEQFTHPYQEAISQSLNNGFMEYALPRALLNFHNLIKFFYTPELKEVYIIDAKLSKEYSAPFKNYYKAIPGAEIPRL